MEMRLLTEKSGAIFVLKMLEKMHEECGFLSVNREKVFKQICDAVMKNECYILVDDEKIIGTVAVEVYEPWYSLDKRFQDRWLYVSPNFRNIQTFKMLLQQAIEHAKYHKLPLYIMLNVEGADRKRKLFKTYMKEAMEVFEVSYVGGSFQAN
ncbi:MAG: GNAT family N-acetyltransferase [Ketobacter sp.]|nr:GNAT family N-acetyltransferase [Ketobacter sp.]